MRPIIAPAPRPALASRGAPAFSVIIPAYQAASVIGEAVESALSQTVAPHEVIVCDDGSTDPIMDALRPYMHRITLLRKENGGAASARNAAVRAASSEFVSWLDADDAYEPERLEATGELAAERPDLDILMTDAYLEADGRVVGRFSRHTPFAEEDQRVAILDRCFIAWPAVRRSLVLRVGGFNEALPTAEDWEFWIRALFHGARAGLVDVPLYRYRIREESLTGARSSTLRARVWVIEDALRAFELTAQEHAVAEHTRQSALMRAQLTEAEAAIRSGASGRRGKCLAVALGRGFGPGTRLRAVLAALAPQIAADYLVNRESRTGRTRLRRSVPSA